MDKPLSLLLKSDKTPTALSAARVALLVFISLVQPAHLAAAGEPLVKHGSILLKDVEGRLDHLTFDNRSQHLFILFEIPKSSRRLHCRLVQRHQLGLRFPEVPR
jgi:hypothetical protein